MHFQAALLVLDDGQEVWFGAGTWSVERSSQVMWQGRESYAFLGPVHAHLDAKVRGFGRPARPAGDAPEPSDSNAWIDRALLRTLPEPPGVDLLELEIVRLRQASSRYSPPPHVRAIFRLDSDRSVAVHAEGCVSVRQTLLPGAPDPAHTGLPLRWDLRAADGAPLASGRTYRPLRAS